MSEPVIALNHLSKSFGDVHAVQDLSLTIAPGTIFGFLGANGAGKTTTIRMLCGLTHPTAGNATIAGTDVWKDRQHVRTKFGYVPHALTFTVVSTCWRTSHFSAAPNAFRGRNLRCGNRAFLGW